MKLETFVPALLTLRNSEVDVVIENLGKAYGEISTMGPEQIVAAWQTVKTVAIVRGLEEDIAVTALLSAMQMRMLMLALKEEEHCQGPLAKVFCSCIGITHRWGDELRTFNK